METNCVLPNCTLVLIIVLVRVIVIAIVIVSGILEIRHRCIEYEYHAITHLARIYTLIFFLPYMRASR